MPIVFFFMTRTPFPNPETVVPSNVGQFKYCAHCKFLDVGVPHYFYNFSNRCDATEAIVASHIGWHRRSMFRLKRDGIILTAVIVAGAVGYGVYSKWAEEGLRRTEADMKRATFPCGLIRTPPWLM